MNDLIKQLQAIEQPLWILKEKDNKLYYEIQKEKYNGFVEFFDCSGAWELIDDPQWSPCSTYRLSPEYSEPKTGLYKVFEIKPTTDNTRYMVETPYGRQTYNDLQRLVGFSGVQFKGQESDLWYMSLNQYIDEKGYLFYGSKLQSLQNGTLKPAVPVKVLFWVEGE